MTQRERSFVRVVVTFLLCIARLLLASVQAWVPFHNKKIAILLTGALFALLSFSTFARAQSFESLGVVLGGYDSRARGGVSGDGSTVAGYGQATNGNQQAFRWSAGAITGLGFLTGDSSSIAFGISTDGSVVVGSSEILGTARSEAFRWQGGTMTGLGYLTGGNRSHALGTNADGSVVVGYGSSNSRQEEAFRWLGGTMTGLGVLPGAGGMSRSMLKLEGRRCSP